MSNFRLLRADEIECRVGTIKYENPNDKKSAVVGVSLLLYKDARCDMAMLDEVVGSKNWMRTHDFKDGKLYCTVSIYDESKSMWIDKEDVGTESNTEAEKGQASDAFKRACVNWGIGRELYTAPFIWITPLSGENLKFAGKGYFQVTSITYDEKNNIDSLVIMDKKGNVRFNFKDGFEQSNQPKQQPKTQRQQTPQSNMNEVSEDYILAALRKCNNVKDLGDIARKYQTEILSNEELNKVYQEQKAKLTIK